MSACIEALNLAAKPTPWRSCHCCTDQMEQQFCSVYGSSCSISPSNEKFSKERALATRFNVPIQTLILLLRSSTVCKLQLHAFPSIKQGPPRGVVLLFSPFVALIYRLIFLRTSSGKLSIWSTAVFKHKFARYCSMLLDAPWHHFAALMRS